jgi:hypothetical protein
MYRLFLHDSFAGEGTNATIRGGEYMDTEFSTINEARATANALLALDKTIGRITIHSTQVIDTVVRS